MNREQRRQRIARATRPRGPKTETRTLVKVHGWAAVSPDDCEVAKKVHELVQAIETGWAIDPQACGRCGKPTVVLHADEHVWACLACSAHGELHTMPGPVIAAGPLLAGDGEILH